MADEPLIGERRPWWAVGNVGGNPFASIGMDWCVRCRMEVDTDTEAHHTGDTFVYRRRCLRCGRTIKWGTYNQVVLLTNRPMPPAAFEWVTDPGRDRR